MELIKWLRLQWDRVSGGALVIAGAVALLTGWSKVSATPYVAEQMPYVVSAGLGGLFLLGVGATLWQSADLRDEWRKLDRLLELEEQRVAAADTAVDERPSSNGTDDDLASEAKPAMSQRPRARRPSAAGS